MTSIRIDENRKGMSGWWLCDNHLINHDTLVPTCMFINISKDKEERLKHLKIIRDNLHSTSNIDELILYDFLGEWALLETHGLNKVFDGVEDILDEMECDGINAVAVEVEGLDDIYSLNSYRGRVRIVISQTMLCVEVLEKYSGHLYSSSIDWPED